MRRAAVVLGFAVCGATPAPAVATFPGKPGRIAYVDVANKGVFSVRPGGGVQLLVRANAAEAPAYSPDGRKVAFTTYPDRSRLDRQTLQVVRADGRHRQVLSRLGEFVPDWSPDGRSLVFNRERPCEVYELMDVECPPRLQQSTNHGIMIRRGGRTRLLRQAGFGPAWSPAGDWIAFGGGGLHLMRPDGSDERTILSDPAFVGDVDWSPSGRRLAFTYDFGTPGASRYGVASVRRDGGGFTVLTRDGFSPSYSPNGRRVVYVREQRGLCDERPAYGGPAGFLWTVRPDGTGQDLVRSRRHPPIPVCGADPDWQPLPP